MKLDPIHVYEHGKLIIGENGFTRTHWDAFVKLNNTQDGAYFDVLHNGLKFKQYVGVIQVGGVIVNIHPKADKADDDAKWKNVLLQMLKACGKVKAQTSGNAQLKRQNINLLEVYFEYFLKELEGLIHSGLVKKYRKQTSNVKALKGKLEFAGNIRKNTIHKERFYTTHQVYDKDHKIHQILGQALEIVGQFTRASRLNDKCRRVELAFPEVKKINPTHQFLYSVQTDRKTAQYERALELARFIILNYSPDINKGAQKMIALLFNMNELWEEYVVKMLKKYALEHESEGWEVFGQESKNFYGTRRSIRPDIVIRKENEVFIIDTKWKRPNKMSANIEDLKQMYAYGRFWNSEKLMLLYPGFHYDSGYNQYKNKENDRREHQCKIARVSVLDDASLDPQIGKNIIDLMVN